MKPHSRFRRSLRPRTARLRARAGIALFVAMFMVVAIGALALSAIYLTANATLISKTYEKEDNLKYEAEAALAMGKAELNYNPAALPGTSYARLMTGKTLTAADAQPINGLTVNLYIGQTGSTSGQFGRFASLVAEARDNNGTGFVRRLELTQESFAKFAYWTNSETNGGTKIYFGGGDQLWGPVWSNDTLSIDVTGATFHDQVGTAKTVAGAANGTFAKGYQINQKPILLPTLTMLGNLSGLATAGGMNFTSPTSGDQTTVLQRIEFIAADMDSNHDSTEANEGFFRVYTANAGNTSWLRADWGGNASTIPTAANVLNCGDWHKVNTTGDTNPKFFPWASHVHPSGATWFDTVVANGRAGGVTTANLASVKAHGDSVLTNTKFSKVLQTFPTRCYLGGDPHLVSVARTTASGAGHYAAADVHKGGEDTTFTPVDQYGSWSQYATTANGTIAANRPADAKYLYPLYRGFNTGTKGVLYASGTVGISGVVRGDITLYSPHTIVILDDLRYANDPANGQCVDVFGIISGENTVVADNGINSPQYVKVSGGSIIQSFDDTPDTYIQGVIMALGSFSAENFNMGPTSAIGCGGTTNGRGCLYLTGGVIQNTRGAVGQSSGTGFIKRYSYDRCAVINPPPYFPTTGRFMDNRYYELDPVRFNAPALFKALTPAP